MTTGVAAIAGRLPEPARLRHLLAPDASDLANRITRYAPDLLVLDRMLPGGDGADACRRLREQGEDIPSSC